MALPPQIATELARAVENFSAVLVGGQAVNMLAEIFSETTPELAEYGPYTSKDVDFFGPRNVAKQLADAIGAKVHYPSMDEHTPNTALVYLEHDGFRLEIDFLDFVLGPPKGKIRTIDIVIDVGEADLDQAVRLKILHPIHCVFSRCNTLLHAAIRRKDSFATNQFKASILIARQYIDLCISDHPVGDGGEACLCFSMLHNFLLRDPIGRRVYKECEIDPIIILEHFADDNRLDERYRQKTLRQMIDRIQDSRTRERA